MSGCFEFLRKHLYDDLEPFWKWKVPNTGKRQGHSYGQILRTCRASQYFVAILAILVTLSLEYSRGLVMNVAIREGVLALLLDLIPLIVLGYCLGMKRLPANYIPLTIMKFYVILEKQVKPQVKDFQVKVLGESRFKGEWTVLTFNPSPGVIPYENQMRNLGLMALTLMTFWAFSKYSTVDLTQYERTVLVTTTVGTASAALLLVSSFAFEAFPGFKTKHRSICELWMILGVTAYLFILLYLFQRLRKSVYGTMRSIQGMRLLWEAAIFTFALHIMLSYIPVIHKGVSAKALMATQKSRVGDAVVPTIVSNSCKIVAAYVYAVAEVIATLHGSLLISSNEPVGVRPGPG